MSEIEFLDPDPDEPGWPEEPGPAQLRRTLVGAGAPALWVVAAALAVAAGFGQLYRITVRTAGSTSSGTISVWGRYASGDGPVSDGHGTRYSIVLVAAAVLLAAAAAGTALQLRIPHARLRRIATALGVAGTAAAAALTTAMYLDFRARGDTLAAQRRAINRDNADNLVSALFQFRIHLGAGVWVALAAAGCGLGALAAGAFDRRVG